MKELKTIKKYTKFIHKEGSKYELEDYDDDELQETFCEFGINYETLSDFFDENGDNKDFENFKN